MFKTQAPGFIFEPGVAKATKRLKADVRLGKKKKGIDVSESQQPLADMKWWEEPQK